MPTSYTKYKGAEFKTRDFAIQAVLALLVIELDGVKDRPTELEGALDWWTIASTVYWGGCVSANLDEYLAGRADLEGVVEVALNRVIDRLPSDQRVEIEAVAIAERAARVHKTSPWTTPGDPTNWARSVAITLRDLIGGRLVQPAEGTYWFVDGAGRGAAKHIHRVPMFPSD